MSRWRITHIAPTGQRHRLVIHAATNTSATSQALLALGEALALSCIRLTAGAPHTQTARPCSPPC